MLGGVEIPFERGLEGHSDADVLTHAVIDALLGALAMGDIGRHFPNTDPCYAGARSLSLLEEVDQRFLRPGGWQVANVDSTIMAEAPRLAPFIDPMRAGLAQALRIAAERVSVKAGTQEGVGAVGRSEAMAAYAVALLMR